MRSPKFAAPQNYCVRVCLVNGDNDMHKKQNKKHLVTTTLRIIFLGVALALPISAVAAPMKTGARTSQPIGHYEYCQKNSKDCRIISQDTRPMTLTRARWKEMVQINAHANAVIKPVTDEEYYGVEELWIYPQRYGDCEDYVLMKRQELMRLGWPASDLLVTVVRQRSGDGHAVLTVRTDRGDFVLDNLNNRILPWHETEYTYLKRQAASHSGHWVDIIDSRKMVGSVR
jgi:predicted transglutaminase-like cysteine proteinase